jgi:hypothetical protein
VVLDARSPVLWGLSDHVLDAEDVPSDLELADALHALRDAGAAWDDLLAPSPEALAAHTPADGGEALVELVLEAFDRSERRSATGWRQLALTACAIAELRTGASEEHNVRGATFPGRPYWARSFSNIYWLLLVFEGPYSELHVEAALLHLLPVVEQLVAALPPFDPPPSKAKVMRFPRPHR